MSDDEVDFVDGVIEKKGYRSKWLRHARAHSGHPINYGIHMDTHHLVSAEAVKISKLSQSLIDKGYMINDINNLVGFPATLPAACHLGLQLHRGDHTVSRPNEEPYHKYVSSLISGKKPKIKSCYGRTKIREKSTEIHKVIDPIGKILLKKINTFKLPLTDIFLNFERGGKGCGGCFDVLPARESVEICEMREHTNETDFRYHEKIESNIRGNKKIIKYSKHQGWSPKVGL